MEKMFTEDSKLGQASQAQDVARTNLSRMSVLLEKRRQEREETQASLDWLKFDTDLRELMELLSRLLALDFLLAKIEPEYNRLNTVKKEADSTVCELVKQRADLEQSIPRVRQTIMAQVVEIRMLKEHDDNSTSGRRWKSAIEDKKRRLRAKQSQLKSLKRQLTELTGMVDPIE